MTAVRFRGGPLDGETHMAPAEWPLPDVFSLLLHADAEGMGLQLGGYRKLDESQWSDEVAQHPGLVRGVLYGWDVDYEMPETGLLDLVVDPGREVERPAWNEATGEGVDLA